MKKDCSDNYEYLNKEKTMCGVECESPKTNFISHMHNARGMILETELYFNGTVDEVIDNLKQYQATYSGYDWLSLESNGDHGYCLVGYVRQIKEHDMVVLNCGIPHTNLREGDEGAVVHIHKNNMYEVEFKDHLVYTVKAIMIRKKEV